MPAIAIGLFGAFAALAVVLSSICNLAFEKLRLQAVADTIAVLASETRQGLVAGSTCENAEVFAKLNKANLLSCQADGNETSIQLRIEFFQFQLTTKAVAKPL